jgi:hypothetical protein
VSNDDNNAVAARAISFTVMADDIDGLVLVEEVEGDRREEW